MEEEEEEAAVAWKAAAAAAEAAAGLGQQRRRHRAGSLHRAGAARSGTLRCAAAGVSTHGSAPPRGVGGGSPKGVGGGSPKGVGGWMRSPKGWQSSARGGTARGWAFSARSAHSAGLSTVRSYLSSACSGFSARSGFYTPKPPRLGPPTEPSQCQVHGPGLHTADVRHPNSFVIEAFDAEGERISEGGDEFIVAVRCNAVGAQARARVYDNLDGSCECLERQALPP